MHWNFHLLSWRELEGITQALVATYKLDKYVAYFLFVYSQPVDLKESFVDNKSRSEVLFFKVLDCQSLTISFAQANNTPLEFCTMMKDTPVQIRVCYSFLQRITWALFPNVESFFLSFCSVQNFERFQR